MAKFVVRDSAELDTIITNIVAAEGCDDGLVRAFRAGAVYGEWIGEKLFSNMYHEGHQELALVIQDGDKYPIQVFKERPGYLEVYLDSGKYPELAAELAALQG